MKHTSATARMHLKFAKDYPARECGARTYHAGEALRAAGKDAQAAAAARKILRACEAKGFGGLRGTPGRHAHEANIAIHYAQRPFIDGCRRSIEQYGAAKAHVQFVEDEAQKAELKKALRRASGILEYQCSCAGRP